ncbi:MAG TPA: glycosyltransferase family 4 protein [Thermoanaerobaculia bacterium]|nr:glycosyltransferase family 4 protein [Thermoanaerobaculia bacterium]
MASDVPRRFLFVSSNFTWGGSEHLWSGTANALAERGHPVTAFKLLRGTGESAMRALRERGGRVVEVARMPLVPRRAFSALLLYAAPLARLLQMLRLRVTAARARPDLVILSLGTNVDGTALAAVLRRLRLPYVIVAHKATDQRWPSDAERPAMRAAYTNAVAAYFVSEHNRRLTEEQLGAPLDNAAIARNPFGVPYAPLATWPSGDGLRLACVARLLPSEKGQDILLRVLARERWRSRALSVTFFGHGPHRIALAEMASRLQLNRVAFAGHVDDVAAIWRDHHALVLPSRCEGLPIVLVEAMLSGRVPIVTNVGGNAEVVRDGLTGFVAAAPSEDALDEAMERAWQRRGDWRAIGARAAESIRAIVPPDPLRVFADELEGIAASTGAAARAAVVGLLPS